MLNRLTAIVSFIGITLAMTVPLAVRNQADANPIVANNSFEVPAGPRSGFTAPFGTITVTGWTFGPSVDPSYEGVGNAGFVTMTAPPDGIEAVFIEGTGTFSQVITGFHTGGRYNVNFFAEGWNFGGRPAQTIQVLLDGTPLTFNAGANNSVTPAAGSFTSFTTDTFTATGTHTLVFLGVVADSNRTTFIDLINVNSLPEPASLGLLAIGAPVLLRRRR